MTLCWKLGFRNFQIYKMTNKTIFIFHSFSFREIICPNANCTTSTLNLQLKPEHDQQRLICKARNTRFTQDFSLEAFTPLNVFCKLFTFHLRIYSPENKHFVY